MTAFTKGQLKAIEMFHKNFMRRVVNGMTPNFEYTYGRILHKTNEAGEYIQYLTDSYIMVRYGAKYDTYLSTKYFTGDSVVDEEIKRFRKTITDACERVFNNNQPATVSPYCLTMKEIKADKKAGIVQYQNGDNRYEWKYISVSKLKECATLMAANILLLYPSEKENNIIVVKNPKNLEVTGIVATTETPSIYANEIKTLTPIDYNWKRENA